MINLKDNLADVLNEKKILFHLIEMKHIFTLFFLL